MEKAYNTKNVPKEFIGEILLNILGDKNILVYINNEDKNDYQQIKVAVLRKLEPTLLAWLQNFRKARRTVDENHVQFPSRLATSWEHYCNLREVKDFNSLRDLIKSDKIYHMLDQETAIHVNIKQGQS